MLTRIDAALIVVAQPFRSLERIIDAIERKLTLRCPKFVSHWRFIGEFTESFIPEGHRRTYLINCRCFRANPRALDIALSIAVHYLYYY